MTDKFDEVECPVCGSGTVGLEEDEVHCRGECGTVWMKDQWDREMGVRRSLNTPEEVPSRWNLDAVQFPRLLDELAAVGVPQLLKEAEWQAIEESMDLPREKIMTLFGRASTAWQNIKDGVLRNAEADNELSDHDRAEVERCRREVYEEAAEKGALILDLAAGDGADYILKEDHNSCWITVGNLSVYVVRTDEGVSVDVYPHFKEAESGPISSLWALFADAETDDDQS
jgi:hypothetical protein